MAPVSELLLYYVRPDGEIVATTYSIKVGHCFENKVKSAWHTDAQTPGTVTQYHVEAAPWSLCGISAVDKSTRFLGSKANLIDADQTFEQLKRFYIEPELRPIWTQCKGTQSIWVIKYNSASILYCLFFLSDFLCIIQSCYSMIEVDIFVILSI